MRTTLADVFEKPPARGDISKNPFKVGAIGDVRRHVA
jgi:hypothetical protein